MFTATFFCITFTFIEAAFYLQQIWFIDISQSCITMNICITISEKWFNLLRDSHSILHGCISVLHTYRQNKDQNYFKGMLRNYNKLRKCLKFPWFSHMQSGRDILASNTQINQCTIHSSGRAVPIHYVLLGPGHDKGWHLKWKHKFYQLHNIILTSKELSSGSNGTDACISKWVTS